MGWLCPETGRRLRFEIEYEGLFRVNGYLHFQFGNHLELHFSVNESKKSVILSETDVIAGTEFSSSLTNKNISRKDGFSSETFYSESLRIGIPTVLRRSATFLMCHFLVLLSVQFLSDIDLSDFLTRKESNQNYFVSMRPVRQEPRIEGIHHEFQRVLLCRIGGGADIRSEPELRRQSREDSRLFSPRK